LEILEPDEARFPEARISGKAEPERIENGIYLKGEETENPWANKDKTISQITP